MFVEGSIADGARLVLETRAPRSQKGLSCVVPQDGRGIGTSNSGLQKIEFIQLNNAKVKSCSF